MKFSDLFTPVPPVSPSSPPLRIERIDEFPSFNLIEKHTSEGKEVIVSIDTGTKAEIAISALSAPLVPLEAPWVDGQRYREAGMVEVSSRLDLYLADPAGPWIRRYGVLLAVSATVGSRLKSTP